MPIKKEDGQVNASSPEALKVAGNEAFSAGDFQRATHMYTLGVDLIVGAREEITPPNWFELDEKSAGVLHVLLSNRSHTQLRAGNLAGAIEDGEHCCLACPGFAKGHLRLLTALEASGTAIGERVRACARGARACPTSADLAAALKDLLAEGGPDARAALDAEHGRVEERLEATLQIAEDPAHPQRFMAAGDFGSALAVGAHGLPKDTGRALHYLQLGAEGGDVASQRNLGLLLLELQRPAEGAEQLRLAADGGDKEAALALEGLGAEADKKREEALAKLRVMASSGDKRAVAMLREFESS